MATAPGVAANIQLDARGPQEAVLYDTDATNPFTHVCYKRSTPFAIEQKDEQFPSGFQFGKVNQLVVPRRGDMLGNIILEITLPAVEGAGVSDRWVESIGYILLRQIRFFVDDVELSRDERLWYDLSDSLFMPQSKMGGIDEMVGRGVDLSMTVPHTLYVPLKLFTCKNHHTMQNFMPLLTSPGSKLILEVQAETFEMCVQSYSGTTPPTELPCNVLIDYVFLDRAEKERMSNRPHQLLIETVQDAEGLSYKELISDTGGNVRIPTDTVTIDLSEVNFPVKSLVWVAYSISDLASKSYFTYNDAIKSVSLKFDGVERTMDEPSEFYGEMQTYYHARRCIPDNVMLYSFALDSSAYQPTGHCTFGEIGRPTLHVTLKEKRNDVIVKVFILGYRMLEFYKGRVRILFS